MNRKMFVLVIAALTVLSLTTLVAAQTPTPTQPLDAQATVGSSFSYQGQLKNAGSPINGSCDLQFQLYDANSGGSQIGATQTVTGVAVEAGFFTVDLDFGGGAFDGSARWLRVGVRCPSGSGSYTTLNPRQPLSATPYALSLMPGAVITNTDTNPNGDPMPAALTGRTTASSGYTIALRGEAYSPDGTAVAGDNYSTEGGTGVWGWSGATSGPAAGVRGTSYSPLGAGIWGHDAATSGEGKGVLGDSDSPDGSGVFGWNDNGGDGVVGIVEGLDAAQGTGVVGLNLATSGEGNGVLGDSNSPDGAGVFGINQDGGDGVVGISDHDGSGVHGASFSDTSFAVSGSNYAETGWGIGVYGNTGSDGPAVAAENIDSGIGLWVRSAHGDPIIAHGEDNYDIEFRVSNDGDVYADGAFQSPAADFAELLPARPGLEPGDVLVIGSDGKLTRSADPYQTTVVGVYSSQPAFLGNSAGEEQDDHVPLALVGVVPVKVSAENGPIQPGDILVSSATAGHAMRAEPVVVDGITFYPSGVVIGKALGSLTVGTGIIDVLVMLQ